MSTRRIERTTGAHCHKDFGKTVTAGGFNRSPDQRRLFRRAVMDGMDQGQASAVSISGLASPRIAPSRPAASKSLAVL